MRASVQWMTIMIAACGGDSSVGMWTKKIKSYVCGCLLFSTLLLQWIHLLQDKNRLHFWRFQFRLFLWHFGVHPCKWVMWAFFCGRKLNSFFFALFLRKSRHIKLNKISVEKRPDFPHLFYENAAAQMIPLADLLQWYIPSFCLSLQKMGFYLMGGNLLIAKIVENAFS